PPPEGRFIPGVVAVERVLAHNDRAAILLRSISVFHDGLAIELDSYLRDRAEAAESLMSHFAAAAFPSASLQASVEDAPATLRELPPNFGAFGGHDFNFGIQFPDGTKVTTQSPYAPDFNFADVEAEPPSYGLESGAGGGTDNHYQHTFFLWPLPGPGT